MLPIQQLQDVFAVRRLFIERYRIPRSLEITVLDCTPGMRHDNPLRHDNPSDQAP
jgi:hypothetical protein